MHNHALVHYCVLNNMEFVFLMPRQCYTGRRWLSFTEHATIKYIFHSRVSKPFVTEPPGGIALSQKPNGPRKWPCRQGIVTGRCWLITASYLTALCQTREDSRYQLLYVVWSDSWPQKYFDIFSCDQAALWMVFSLRLSVCLSVRLSVCHTFLTMFPSSYHHEIFRSYYIGPG